MELSIRILVCVGFLITSLTSLRAKSGYIEGSVRMNSSQSLEVYHDKQWRFICAENWNTANSNVACKMLGYNTVFVTFKWDDQHANASKWIKNLRCHGDENNIDECEMDEWFVSICRRTISIFCFGKYTGTSCGGRVCGEDQTFCCKNKQTAYCCSDVAVSPLKPPTHKTTTAAAYEKDDDPGLRYLWIGCLVGVIAIAICAIASFCHRRNSQRMQRSASTNQPNTPTEHVNKTTTIPSDDPPAYSTIYLKKDSLSRNPPHECSDNSCPPPPYSIRSIA